MHQQHSLLKIVIILLFIQNKVTGFFTEHKYNSSLNWSSIRHIQSIWPLVIETNGSLIHIIDSFETLKLISLNYPTCEVTLSLTYHQRSQWRGTSLGNGKVVLWMLNYDFNRHEHHGEWKFLIVDPHNNCSRWNFEVRDSKALPIHVIEVIGYHKSFDIFITSLVHGEPSYTYVYRYNDDGNPLSSFNVTIIPDPDSQPFYGLKKTYIHPALEHKTSNGYFYLQQKWMSPDSVLLKLDSNFAVAGPIKHFNFSINRHGLGLTTYSARHDNFTMCHVLFSVIDCLMLDSDLNQIAEINLPKLLKPGHLSLTNIPGGGAILAQALRNKTSYVTPIYIMKLRVDGTASETLLLGEIDCRITGFQTLNSYQIDKKAYCFVASCVEMVYTKCIDLV